MAAKTTFLKKRQTRFIELLAEGTSVARAALTVGMCRASVYNWRKDHPEFAVEWDNAVATGIDFLEDEARKRAINGSDPMLTLWLKCRRPEVWNQPPPQPAPVVDAVQFKITTVREAIMRIEQLGMRPMQINGDFEDGAEEE